MRLLIFILLPFNTNAFSLVIPSIPSSIWQLIQKDKKQTNKQQMHLQKKRQRHKCSIIAIMSYYHCMTSAILSFLLSVYIIGFLDQSNFLHMLIFINSILKPLVQEKKKKANVCNLMGLYSCRRLKKHITWCLSYSSDIF